MCSKSANLDPRLSSPLQDCCLWERGTSHQPAAHKLWCAAFFLPKLFTSPCLQGEGDRLRWRGFAAKRLKDIAGND